MAILIQTTRDRYPRWTSGAIYSIEFPFVFHWFFIGFLIRNWETAGAPCPDGWRHGAGGAIYVYIYIDVPVLRQCLPWYSLGFLLISCWFWSNLAVQPDDGGAIQQERPCSSTLVFHSRLLHVYSISLSSFFSQGLICAADHSNAAVLDIVW